jgi:hypothetical protein
LEGLATLLKENLTMYFANWYNNEFGDIFLKGSFLQISPPTQKPYGLQVMISNCLVVRDIMLSANDDGNKKEQNSARKEIS